MKSWWNDKKPKHVSYVQHTSQALKVLRRQWNRLRRKSKTSSCRRHYRIERSSYQRKITWQLINSYSTITMKWTTIRYQLIMERHSLKHIKPKWEVHLLNFQSRFKKKEVSCSKRPENSKRITQLVMTWFLNRARCNWLTRAQQNRQWERNSSRRRMTCTIGNHPIISLRRLSINTEIQMVI